MLNNRPNDLLLDSIVICMMIHNDFISHLSLTLLGEIIEKCGTKHFA
jgi:hypothetical protein